MNQIFKKENLFIAGILCIVFYFSYFYFSKHKEGSKETNVVYSLKDPSYQAWDYLSQGESSGVSQSESFAVDIDQVIEDYLDWAEYPPNSRPLLDSHADILNPKQILVSSQNLPIVENGKIVDSGYSCNFQPEYHTVTENRSMRIFLRCNKTGKMENEKLKLESTEIIGKAGNKTILPPSIDGNDSGMDGDEKNGDFIYTYHFRPRISDWGDFFVTTKFRITSDPKQSVFTMTHHFFSSPIAPAVFTGKFDDYLTDGSLAIDFEMNVREAGRYTIEANLYTSTDEPIGYARNDKKLNSGKQTIPLLFFGKAILKKRESGPFKIQFLRGELNTDVIQEDLLTKSPQEVDRILSSIHDDRPKKKVVPYYEGGIETKFYELSEFSNKDYDSEEKRNRLSELQQLKKTRMP